MNKRFWRGIWGHYKTKKSSNLYRLRFPNGHTYSTSYGMERLNGSQLTQKPRKHMSILKSRQDLGRCLCPKRDKEVTGEAAEAQGSSVPLTDDP